MEHTIERERERKKSANSLLGLLAHRVGFAVSLSGNIPFDISIRAGASQGTAILTNKLAFHNWQISAFVSLRPVQVSSSMQTDIEPTLLPRRISNRMSQDTTFFKASGLLSFTETEFFVQLEFLPV